LALQPDINPRLCRGRQGALALSKYPPNAIMIEVRQPTSDSTKEDNPKWITILYHIQHGIVNIT
jgi:hypothetical protein